jgi:aminoglycoside 3-N-acetyltransferase
MAGIKHLAHRFLPKSIVAFLQKRNKKNRKNAIQKQARFGGMKPDSLLEQFKRIGIEEGDVLLVHAALSKMGYVEGGAKTVVECLLKAVGQSGHVLMPTSSNDGRQLDFMRQNPIFDVRKTPSKMGAISESFRNLPEAKRSMHPTESVACIGPHALEFVQGHFGVLTPYQSDSPFGKVIESKGKILMIGVTFDNAGTNVHCLEDAVYFPFPVYHPEIFSARVIDYNGHEHIVQTKVHNPEMSAKRYCDYLIPIFENEGVLSKHRIGDAKCLLIDAKAMFESLKNQLASGKTIYGKV